MSFSADLQNIEGVVNLPPSIDSLYDLFKIVNPNLKKEELIAIDELERQKMLRKLRMKSHPDKFQPSLKKKAKEVFTNLTDFYESCVEQISSSQEHATTQEESKGEPRPGSATSPFEQYCESTQSEDAKDRANAYYHLSEFARRNYKTLTLHDIEKLVECTSHGIRHHKEVTAVELWITICMIEQDLIRNQSEDYRGYVMVAFRFVTPLLTLVMRKDVSRDDESSICNDAAICLKLVSQIVKDAIIPEILPFVEQQIEDEDWRMREAAIMAFCSILDGPSSENIGPHVNWMITFLLKGLHDPHDKVKDTSVWTIAIIFELYIQAIPSDSFVNLVEGLMSTLEQNASISANSAYAIHNLALAFVDDDQAENDDTNDLSCYMEKFLQKLSRAVLRGDADNNNLRSTAMEAMSALVRCAASDCSGLLEKLLGTFLDRLHYSLRFIDNPQYEMESRQMCSLIHEILASRIINAQFIAEHHADHTIQIMIDLLENSNCPESYEEAFTVLSELCNICEISEEIFGTYVTNICAQVKVKMNNESERVCILAVDLVSSIAQFCERPAVLKNAKFIMEVLVESLQNEKVHCCVKPHVLACIGDIARAVAHGFEPYLQDSMTLLKQVSQIAMLNDDGSSKQLLEGVLDAYNGIVNGMKKPNKDLQLCLRPYKSAMEEFLRTLSKYEANLNGNVWRKSLTLLLELNTGNTSHEEH